MSAAHFYFTFTLAYITRLEPVCPVIFFRTCISFLKGPLAHTVLVGDYFYNVLCIVNQPPYTSCSCCAETAHPLCSSIVIHDGAAFPASCSVAQHFIITSVEYWNTSRKDDICLKTSHSVLSSLKSKHR